MKFITVYARSKMTNISYEPSVPKLATPYIQVRCEAKPKSNAKWKHLENILVRPCPCQFDIKESQSMKGWVLLPGRQYFIHKVAKIRTEGTYVCTCINKRNAHWPAVHLSVTAFHTFICSRQPNTYKQH